MQCSIDVRMLCNKVVRYLILGFVISIASLLVTRQKMGLEEVIILGLVGSATFAIIDTFAPTLTYPVQLGAGFGVGASLVGFPA